MVGYIENGREGRWAAWRRLPHICLFTCEPQSGRYSSDIGELTSQQHQPLYCWVPCCARYHVHGQASCCDVKPANVGELDHFSLGQWELRPLATFIDHVRICSLKSSVGYGDAVLSAPHSPLIGHHPSEVVVLTRQGNSLRSICVEKLKPARVKSCRPSINNPRLLS
jgi:hypothetical protein